ncbi:MAG TPA: MarR family transcriptional regulator [Burkholderiales bacterium]
MDELYSRPGFLLRRGHQIAVSIFMEECAKIGLTPPQHGVLIAASQHPGLSQSDVARLLGFDRATIGQVVQGLEARGFLRRHSSNGNRRNKSVQLTPKGAAALKRAGVAMERTSERLLSPFSRREQAVFVELLGRLASRLNGDSRTPVAGRESVTPVRPSRRRRR